MLLVPAGWIGDFAGGGYLLPLDDFIKGDAKLDWDGIMQIYREQIVNWDGKTYAMPLDGDLHTVIVRTDLLENPTYKEKFKEKYKYDLNPPRTWEEYRDIAEFATGWDWDGDGKVEYGVVESMKKSGQAYWMFLSRAMPYVAIPGDPGVLFDPDTMKSEINNPGFVQALTNWVEILKFGVPGMVNMDVNDARDLYATGDAALMIDWGDMPIIGATSEESAIKGKFMNIMTPGSKRVWDRKNNEWVSFPNVSYAPFLAFGGWIGEITATCQNPEAAYDFYSFLASPEYSYIDVTTPRTGHQPYRYEHFEKLDRWKEYGFNDPEKEYLKAVKDSIAYPNTRTDLRIPGTARYYEILDTQLCRALAGELTPKIALDKVAEEWDILTNELGQKAQMNYYRISLGLPPTE